MTTESIERLIETLRAEAGVYPYPSLCSEAADALQSLLAERGDKVMVPREPTNEMILAAQREMVNKALMLTRQETVCLYLAMLSAHGEEE